MIANASDAPRAYKERSSRRAGDGLLHRALEQQVRLLELLAGRRVELELLLRASAQCDIECVHTIAFASSLSTAAR